MDIHTLSICSGYGGIELGLKQVIDRTRVVCYVENEITQAKILAQRIKEGRLDEAPIWSDLRSFNAKLFRGKVDILTGGFPCQPHSLAGRQQGEQDPRELSGEVLRIADELGRPTLFLENVPGIKRFYWDNIRPKLQAMGYRTEEILVTARETGAPHKRQRIFILANAGTPRLDGWYDAMADSIRSRVRGWSERLQQESGTWGADSTVKTERSDSELAYANNSRDTTREHGTDRNWQTQDEGRQGQPFTESTGQDECMVNPISRGTQESDARRQSSEQECDNTGQVLANSIGKGLQRGIGGHSGMGERNPSEGIEHDTGSPRYHIGHSDTALPIYPPRPDDDEGWAYVLTKMQTLEPAFCRVANGSTPWVDERLRSIGNGVVPAMASTAWIYLIKRFR